LKGFFIMALINLTKRQQQIDLAAGINSWVSDRAHLRNHDGFAKNVSQDLESFAGDDLGLIGVDSLLVDLAHCFGMRSYQTKGLGSTPQNAGGYLIGVEVSELAAPLRPFAAVVARGAEVIQAKGNRTLPRVSTAPSAQFVNEGDTLTEASMTISTLNLVPRRAGVLLSYTKELAIGSSGTTDIATFLSEDLPRSIGALINNKSLNGTGVGEPSGIYTVATNSVTHSAATTYQNVLDYPRKTLDQNANPEGALGWVLHPDVALQKWSTNQEFTGSSFGLYHPSDRTVAGYPVSLTTDASTTGAVFGDWSQYRIVFWGPIRLVVDPYNQAARRAGKVEITAHAYVDFGPVFPNLFTVNSGSVVQ
jgi:HK97 family phage major capsid protein